MVWNSGWERRILIYCLGGLVVHHSVLAIFAVDWHLSEDGKADLLRRGPW